MILIDIVVLLVLGIVVYKTIQNTSKTKVESLEKEAEEVLIRAKRMQNQLKRNQSLRQKKNFIN